MRFLSFLKDLGFIMRIMIVSTLDENGIDQMGRSATATFGTSPTVQMPASHV